jgi:hypothetical protein
MKKLTSFACTTITLMSFSCLVNAKLPDPSPEAKEAAKLTAAKTAYGDKVSAYKLCQVQNNVARSYAVKAKVVDTPPCVDPGEFKPPEATPPAATVATQQQVPTPKK